MATRTALQRDDPEGDPGERHSRIGWIVFVLLLALFAALVLATMRRGVDADPRIANPNPGRPPYPISSTLQSALFTWMSLGQVVVLFGILLGLSWRRRRLHWAAIIAIGALFTGLVDPIANWATFASLNPSVAHLPTTWPWARLAPLSEPASAFLGGYASYYLLVGLAMYWIAHRLLRRFRTTSWVARHPLLSLFVGAWILSFPLNAALQLAWMKIGMLVYTQFLGPVLHVGHLQLPVLILFYDPFVYATVALLCVRNERGESTILTGLCSRVPGRAHRPRNGSARQIVAAGALIVTSILVPIGAFSVIRARGAADHVVYDKWPFPETGVYDPYGVVEKAGKPGPFFR